MHVIKLPKNSSAGRKLNSTGQIFFTNSVENWIPKNLLKIKQTEFLRNRGKIKFHRTCWNLDSTEFVENCIPQNLWKMWKTDFKSRVDELIKWNSTDLVKNTFQIFCGKHSSSGTQLSKSR